jgi:hypothetical protein
VDLAQIETLSLEEVAEKYEERWVGVKVISRDNQSGQPLTVKVLVKSVDPGMVRTSVGLDDFCIYYTGQLLPDIKSAVML